MKPTTIAVDLAKNVFEVAVWRRAGKVSDRRRLSRPAFTRYVAKLQPATVLLEVCGFRPSLGPSAPLLRPPLTT